MYSTEHRNCRRPQWDELIRRPTRKTLKGQNAMNEKKHRSTCTVKRRQGKIQLQVVNVQTCNRMQYHVQVYTEEKCNT